MDIYQKRREKLYGWMAENGIDVVLFEDTEARRDTSIRWLTGQPGDALLFLSVQKQSLLVPWDINMANKLAHADAIVPYERFGRQVITAFQHAVSHFKMQRGAKAEIPPVTPYPLFLQYRKELPDVELVCRNEGIHTEVEKLRAIKDKEEIRIYRHVSNLTNEMITLLEKGVQTGSIQTESDAALFIEAEARKQGCEGTGFETLAAGPERSFGIHAFPAYTAAPFAGKGLSILDFGLKYEGYTTDVTLTFVRDASPEQEKLLRLIEQAYILALSLVRDGTPSRDIAVAVDDFFGTAQKTMPHGLGHGIGLEAHEAPGVNSRPTNTWILKPGMIITLEPGLYDPLLGGCRLENDILLTEKDPEVLTKSRIIRL